MATKLVEFDVGGKHYKVSRDTVERGAPEGSFLANLVSNKWKEGNCGDPIFIDRDGDLFAFVLGYIRDGKIYLPDNMPLDAVTAEMEYYGIPFETTMMHRSRGLAELKELSTKLKKRQADVNEAAFKISCIQLSFRVADVAAKGLRHGAPTTRLRLLCEEPEIKKCLEGSIALSDVVQRPFFKECVQARGFLLVDAKYNDRFKGESWELTVESSSTAK